MQKETFNYFYVQALLVSGEIQIVPHSLDQETNEPYHLFINRVQAVELMKSSKEASPKVKFRVVKYTETYELGNWE